MNEMQQKTADALQKCGYDPDYASRLATRLPVDQQDHLQKLTTAELREEIDQIERDRYEARAIVSRLLRMASGRAQDLVEQLNDAEVAQLLAATLARQVKDVLNHAYDRRREASLAKPTRAKKAESRKAAVELEPGWESSEEADYEAGAKAPSKTAEDPPAKPTKKKAAKKATKKPDKKPDKK